MDIISPKPNMETKTTAPPPTSSQTPPNKKESFGKYVYKVLKQVHPDTGINEKAAVLMDNIMYDLFHRFATAAQSLTAEQNSPTLTQDIMQQAVVQVLNLLGKSSDLTFILNITKL